MRHLPQTVSRDPEHAADRAAVVGDECHIVGRSPDGPRGRGTSIGDLDGYENLVLLWANDHAVVDGQQETWTVERLRRTKVAHERWVAGTTFGAADSSRGALMGLYERALSVSVCLPERLERVPRELVGTIFRTAQERSDIWADLAFDQKLMLEAELDGPPPVCWTRDVSRRRGSAAEDEGARRSAEIPSIV
jgi:hypothetical protein